MSDEQDIAAEARLKLELLHQAREGISNLLNEIAGYFNDGAKITLLVRRPGNPKADFMMTNDDPAEAIALIERRVAGGVLPEAESK